MKRIIQAESISINGVPVNGGGSGGFEIKSATVTLTTIEDIVPSGPGSGLVPYTEISDPDGLWDDALKRFVIPAGTVGTVKGIIMASILLTGGTSKGYISIRKNGGSIEKAGTYSLAGLMTQGTFPVEGIAGDYWEIWWVTGESGGPNPTIAASEFNWARFDLYSGGGGNSSYTVVPSAITATTFTSSGAQLPYTDVNGAVVTLNPTGTESWEIVFDGTVWIRSADGNPFSGNVAITDSANNVVDGAIALILQRDYTATSPGGYHVHLRARVTVSSSTTYKLRMRFDGPNTSVISVGDTSYSGSGLSSPNGSARFYGIKYGGSGSNTQSGGTKTVLLGDNSGQSIPTSTVTNYSPNITLFNPDSIYNTGTGIFTIPTITGTGIVTITLSARGSNVSGAIYSVVLVKKNGGTTYEAGPLQYQYSSQRLDYSGSVSLPVVSNDTVQLYLYHTSGGSNTLYSGAADGTINQCLFQLVYT
jgi:hypothetical protein